MSGCHEPITKECHCKCHVSQNEHCDMCSEIYCSPMMLLIHTLQNNIDALEHLVKENWEVNYKRCEAFGKRIIGLEEMVGKLIDEKDHNSDHDERIHDLENIQSEPRLIRLEQWVNSHEAYPAPGYDKPQKPCPACLGSGELSFKEIAQQDYQIAKKGDRITRTTICQKCKGEGIVWG